MIQGDQITVGGVDIVDLRMRQSETPLRPYEILFGADRWSSGKKTRADAIIEKGWTFNGFPPLRLRPPIEWDVVCAEHRSWHFHLHSWDALGPVLTTYDNTRETRYLKYAVDVALDWAKQYTSLETTSPFAWYDMAIGVRAYRLAYLIDAAMRESFCTDEDVRELFNSLLLHIEALADDSRFAAHSNHGFYFAAGQAALARRFPRISAIENAERQARDRLHQLIDTQFTEEGVHREHSPDYHRMVLETFDGLLQADLITGEEFWKLNDRIQEALAWFILPNGHLAMFGDSPHHLMIRPDFSHVQNPALRFIVSGGKEGKPPSDSMRGFRSSGYAVIRDGWPSGSDDFKEWSYLAQTCAFHSRAHKQADDLSFIWYDHGQEILTDAGRFGYLDPSDPKSDLRKEGFRYSHPDRVYVESTRAHNTVEIDGRSFPRMGVKPYGSALLNWGEKAGVYFIESHARHWRSIRHARVLLFRPEEWLIVFDWLWDDKKKPHQFTQRFHFAPELERLENNSHLTFSPRDTVERLYVVPLLPTEMIEPVKGQRDPYMLGWLSREDGIMTPCWSGGYVSANVARYTFATLFAFGNEAPQPLFDNTRTSTNGREAQLTWRQGCVDHAVIFSRPERDSFVLDYRIALAQ